MAEFEVKVQELMRNFMAKVASAKRLLVGYHVAGTRIEELVKTADNLTDRVRNVKISSALRKIQASRVAEFQRVYCNRLEHRIKMLSKKLDALIERMTIASLERSLGKMKLSKNPRTVGVLPLSVKTPREILVRVKRGRNVFVEFLIYTRSPLKKLIEAYYDFCNAKKIKHSADQLLFKGKAIQTTDTPLSLGMKNLDIIIEKHNRCLKAK